MAGAWPLWRDPVQGHVCILPIPVGGAMSRVDKELTGFVYLCLTSACPIIVAPMTVAPIIVAPIIVAPIIVASIIVATLL